MTVAQRIYAVLFTITKFILHAVAVVIFLKVVRFDSYDGLVEREDMRILCYWLCAFVALGAWAVICFLAMEVYESATKLGIVKKNE